MTILRLRTLSHLTAGMLGLSALALGSLYASSLSELWDAAQGRASPFWPTWAVTADALLFTMGTVHAALTVRSLRVSALVIVGEHSSPAWVLSRWWLLLS
ncbi:MAG: hypothetical protein EBU81_13715, partial [Proteobacteria bacterium]|nr:hypothetical protein [Pseudomonadota bacterium]